MDLLLIFIIYMIYFYNTYFIIGGVVINSNLLFNFLFVLIKILMVFGIIKQFKDNRRNYGIIQIMVLFVFDFIMISTFYKLNSFKNLPQNPLIKIYEDR